MSEKATNPKITQLLKELPKDWQETVLDLCSEGGTRDEIISAIGLTNGAYQQLMEESDVFATVIYLGKTYAKAWWLKQGRINIDNKGFNTPLWKSMMQNLWGWSDKPSSEAEDLAKIIDNSDPETLMEDIFKRISGLDLPPDVLVNLNKRAKEGL